MCYWNNSDSTQNLPSTAYADYKADRTTKCFHPFRMKRCGSVALCNLRNLWIIGSDLLLNNDLISKDPRITTCARMPIRKLAKILCSHLHISNITRCDCSSEILYHLLIVLCRNIVCN